MRTIELEFKRKPLWARQAVISAAVGRIEKKQTPVLKLSWPRGQPRGGRQPYDKKWGCRKSREGHRTRNAHLGSGQRPKRQKKDE